MTDSIWRGALLWLGCTLSLGVWASGLQNDLQRYNQLKLSEDAQLYPPDGGETAAFQGYKFVCRKQADNVPAETAAASAAFQQFVAEARAHSAPDPSALQRRRDLLAEAVKAGGWRARYFDAMWGIWRERNSPAGKGHFNQLMDMAEAGNPAALQGLLHWTSGMYDNMPQRIVLLKAAIERGNAWAMSTVGFNLGTRTHTLRPMAIAMLECAAAQDDGAAHMGLGRIAWLEGRWVDAYRAWQRGANLGCSQCLDRMDDLGMIQPGSKQSVGTYGKDSQVAALRSFYESQFLYSISHLIELRLAAPPALQVQWSDEQVVAVIKARISRYGLP